MSPILDTRSSIVNSTFESEWIDDRERRCEAGIPDTVGFQTKCELARLMVERVYNAQIPICWIVADTALREQPGAKDLARKSWVLVCARRRVS